MTNLHSAILPSTTAEELAPEKATLKLTAALRRVQQSIAPVWPLADYVAVNPCLGLLDDDFLTARQRLRQVRSAELLMPLTHFQNLWAEGEFSLTDIRQAIAECRQLDPLLFDLLTPQDVLGALAAPRSEARTSRSEDRRFWTVSEVVDHVDGGGRTAFILDAVSRTCAAHFDGGQAAWESPWQGESLFAAWRAAAQIDRRPELEGWPRFRKFVAALPANPQAAIQLCLEQLAVPSRFWEQFLQCQLGTVAGWAAFVRYQVRESEQQGQANDDLIGLLAIRLAYDTALSLRHPVEVPRLCWARLGRRHSAAATLPRIVPIRYVLQTAVEIAYRRSLLRGVMVPRAARPQAERASAQLVFCIDVRSERFRRQLEHVQAGVQTFGFAGFFALPVRHVAVGESHGTCQCPVLLQPSLTVQETLSGASADAADALQSRVQAARQRQSAWRTFQTSAASCFSFVETAGLAYLGKLAGRTIRALSGRSATERPAGVSAAEQAHIAPQLEAGVTLEQRVNLAEGLLRNLGLTSGLARIVVFCGHGSETMNNPYQASFDCGACGGHSGAPNARLAASLLNEPAVRDQLARRGIFIPGDTWFAAALHNTTTDALEFFGLDQTPESHREEMKQLWQSAVVAGCLTRSERAQHMETHSSAALLQRAADWSEVRPELGLAGNAAFIIAPRDRTQGLSLDGRSFLHSYDFRLDPEFKTLELILTAPLVVASWINLQYYASTVDNQSFGSGNKVLHNVVGRFGVLVGNGGDLQTGLPWQSLHDGRELVHRPQRLQVLVAAPRQAITAILERHTAVRNLVCNGWLTLLAIDGEQIFRCLPSGEWSAEPTERRGGDDAFSLPSADRPRTRRAAAVAT